MYKIIFGLEDDGDGGDKAVWEVWCRRWTGSKSEESFICAAYDEKNAKLVVEALERLRKAVIL